MANMKSIRPEPTQPDGLQVNSTPAEKLGFHGAAPVAQAAVALAAGANPTKAEFDALVTALVNKGLIALA